MNIPDDLFVQPSQKRPPVDQATLMALVEPSPVRVASRYLAGRNVSHDRLPPRTPGTRGDAGR